MTIRNNPLNYNSTDSHLPINESSHPVVSGFTKEQLILINLKHLARNYLEIEQQKQKFAKSLL
ncbi:MAG: hypothetical protein KAW66_03345, partial [Candidatus Lokiarchaeota archaeon]|nr:hypothetical protein [Candidatus Lokiarchaeota archaeon]